MIMTDEQLEKMCKYIVDGWDMDTLVSHAYESLFCYYRNHPIDALSQVAELDLTVGEIDEMEMGFTDG